MDFPKVTQQGISEQILKSESLALFLPGQLTHPLFLFQLPSGLTNCPVPPSQTQDKFYREVNDWGWGVGSRWDSLTPQCFHT